MLYYNFNLTFLCYLRQLYEKKKNEKQMKKNLIKTNIIQYYSIRIF